MASKLPLFLAELKRRKVTRVALLYVIVGVGVIEGAQLLFDAFEIPRIAWQIVTFITVLGFPVALVLAWAYEIRPEELRGQVDLEATAAQEDSAPVPKAHRVVPMPPGHGAPATIPRKSLRAEASAPSIVVLPFENLSPDPDNAFFADGLTEELIADLSKVKGLRVISRTSAMTFKGTTETVPAIARELNVRYVLEGSVRREATSLRITAQLIDADADDHLWAEKYAGTMEDVFDLQETLSRQIVDALKVTVTPDEDRRLAARPITDVQAHDIWLRARQHALSMTEQGLAKAKTLVEQALDLEGENALLHATMAWVHAVRWAQLDEGAEDVLAIGRAHATRAMELDPDLPWSLLAMAVIRLRETDLQGFVRLGKEVLTIERNTHTLTVLSLYLAYAGRMEAAQRYALEAASLDPLSWLTTHAKPNADLFAGHPDAAFEAIRDLAHRLAHGEPWAAFEVGYTALQADRREEARGWFRQSMESESPLYSRLGSAFYHLVSGDFEEVGKALEREALSRIAGRSGYTSYMMASSYAGVKNTDKALAWLECAVNQGFLNHRYMSEHDLLLVSLRDDPRFAALIEDAKKRQTALEV